MGGPCWGGFGRSDSADERDEADGGWFGGLDQPAAGGRDRLSMDLQKKGRWAAASGLGVCFGPTTGTAGTRHETDDSSFWTLRDQGGRNDFAGDAHLEKSPGKVNRTPTNPDQPAAGRARAGKGNS